MPERDERKPSPTPTHAVIGLPKWWTETVAVFGPLLGGKSPDDIAGNLADFAALDPEERQGWMALLAYRQLYALAEVSMWLQRLDSRTGRVAGVSRKQLSAMIRLLQEQLEDDDGTDDEDDDDGTDDEGAEEEEEAIEARRAAEEGARRRRPAPRKPAADKPAADKPAADKPAADKPAADKPRRQRREKPQAEVSRPEGAS